VALRMGIIGCGNVVLRRHLPALLTTPGIELRVVADPTPDRLQAARDGATLADRDAFTDWREALARPDVDALLIATPQRFRPEIAQAAAAAGKHLLCEKPLASSPAEAQEMIDAARRHGVILATVHNYLFAPVYRAIKEIAESAEIGVVELAMLNFLGVEDRPGAQAYQPRWRHTTTEAGGGVLMDMLHAVYLANWFLGAAPVAVSATVDRRRGGEGDVEDIALVRYDYPRGHALVNVAWGAGPGGVALGGTKGCVPWSWLTRTSRPSVPPSATPPGPAPQATLTRACPRG
jgi:predicted dehydrogenase